MTASQVSKYREIRFIKDPEEIVAIGKNPTQFTRLWGSFVRISCRDRVKV